MTPRLSDIDKALLKEAREREREEAKNAKRDQRQREREEAQQRSIPTQAPGRQAR